MKRKINLVGNNTLTVSLPSQWAKEKGLKKGDEIDVCLGDSSLILSLAGQKQKEKEINLDISNFSKHMLCRHLEVLYMIGYGKIILTYTVQEILADKEKKKVNVKNLIKHLSNRFIGMEIVSQGKNMTELRCFLLDEEKDLQKIEKRIFFLLKDTFDEFLDCLDGRHHEFLPNVHDYHENVSKFITYYLRVLDQSNTSENEKKQLHTLHLIIDKLMDKFRHINEMIHRHGCTERVRKHLKNIFELVYEQFSALHSGEIKKELVSKRYDLVRQVEGADYTLEELRVMGEAKIFLDTINDFSRAVIVRKLK